MLEKKCPAVFFDRDGVINIEKSYITSVEKLEIYPFAFKSIVNLKSKGYKIFIVTNQSAVARKMMTEDELIIINNKILKELPIDKIYYCPHYSSSHLPLDKKYNIECECRKPKAGMILKAIEEYNILTSESFMVGDRESDIISGKNAGLKTVLVKTGYGVETLQKGIDCDYVFDDIEKFSEFINVN